MLLVACQASTARADAADPWFARDKALHFSLSAGVAGGSYAGSVLLVDSPWQRSALAAGFTLSLGAAKELYDATGHGDPSWRDFTWDVLGCALGITVALLIDVLLRPKVREQTLRIQFSPHIAQRDPPHTAIALRRSAVSR
jgi:putative lipoprotein